MRSVRTYTLLAGFSLTAVVGCSPDGASVRSGTNNHAPISDAPSADGRNLRNRTYRPTIVPADFSAKVDNPYLPLVPGTLLKYIEKTKDGEQENEITITNDVKTIMGVPCVVVHDVVLKDGRVTEDTWDWYSQHKDGTVWYFGEDTTEISPGGLRSKEGSWEAGVDGAQPGIMMPGEQKTGEPVRSEYYRDHAEDMLQIVAVKQAATVPAGAFPDCVKTREWSLLEPGHENKWYAKGVGIVRETSTGGDELTLISVTRP